MNIKKFISEWISASNSFDTEKYLTFYTADAVLNDPSVGRKFEGVKGIREYFENYFIGYKTYTTMTGLLVKDETHALLEVEFSGNFPEGKIGGNFEFTFQDGKIAYVTADLTR
jgi:hypothetical protein